MLDTQLARLEASELVRRLKEEELAYLIKHGLVQETARASLLLHERKRLSQLVGEALEKLYPARRAELAPLLAQHFANAGNDEKTLAYATLAGDEAMRVNANALALEQYTRALELAQRLDAASDVLQNLFLKRGRVLELSSDYNAALEHYETMRRTAETRKDRALELAALMACATIHAVPSVVYDAARAKKLSARALRLARALKDKEAEAKILWNMMLMESRVGKGYRVARKHGQAALKIARENNLRERLAYLLNDLSPLLVFHGEAERGTQYNLEARALWREFGNLPMLSSNFGYATMNHLIVGELDEAFAASAEGLRISREIGNAWNEAFAQTWIGEAYVERGEIETAIRVMGAAVELGTRVFPPTLVMTQSDLARLYADCGDTARGIELSERALAVADQRFPALRPWAVGALGHANILAGDLERARALLGEPPDLARDEYNPRFSIDTLRAHIELALADGDFARALTLCDALLEYGQTNALRQYEPDVLRLRALAWMGLEKWDEAAQALENARVSATEMTARWSLMDIFEAARALEMARGNVDAAKNFGAQANELREYIAARMPEELRGGFLRVVSNQ